MADKIMEMSKESRPYEKCLRFGPDSLTDAELLAVLLRTGTRGESVLSLAERLLHPLFGRAGLVGLHEWTREQLLSLRGIGQVKAVQILCLSELSRRLAKARFHDGPDLSSAGSVAAYFMEDMRHLPQEVLKIVYVNTRMHMIGSSDISRGTINASIISPRELFREALKKNAVSIILLHNHPSGDPAPSREDISVTKRVKEAGFLIGIELLDHIVIGDRKYVSLQESGLMG